jgi:hypothetical protein
MQLSVLFQSDRIEKRRSSALGPHKHPAREKLTLRSFFSLAVNFAFGPFFLGAEPDLLDDIPVSAVRFPAKVVSASDTFVLLAAMAAAICTSRALAAF